MLGVGGRHWFGAGRVGMLQEPGWGGKVDCWHGDGVIQPQKPQRGAPGCPHSPSSLCMAAEKLHLWGLVGSLSPSTRSPALLSPRPGIPWGAGDPTLAPGGPHPASCQHGRAGEDRDGSCAPHRAVRAGSGPVGLRLCGVGTPSL